MSPTEIRELEKLVRAASLVTLHIKDKKAGLGHDMQNLIADALQSYADLLEQSDD